MKSLHSFYRLSFLFAIILSPTYIHAQVEVRAECENTYTGGEFDMSKYEPLTITAPNSIEYIVPDNRVVVFVACESISLEDGFHAQSGSDFHAYIDENMCKTEAFTLKEKLDGTYYEINSGKVPFYYYEKYTNISELNYEVYNSKHEALFSSENLPQSSIITYGNNVVQLDLRGLKDSQPTGEFFVLEVTDPKGMTFFARFRFKPVESEIINECEDALEGGGEGGT